MGMFRIPGMRDGVGVFGGGVSLCMQYGEQWRASGAAQGWSIPKRPDYNQPGAARLKS